MIHLLTLNPAIDLEFDIRKPVQGKIGSIQKFELTAGGKALNVARFLKALKVPARAWFGAGAGDDSTHVLYRSLLKKEGLHVHFLPNVQPIRFNLVLHEKNESAKHNHPGFQFAGGKALLQTLKSQLKKGDLLVLTGRLPKGNEGLYAGLIRYFNPRQVKTVVDTSGFGLKKALEQRPWFWKVNLHEFAEAWGGQWPHLKKVQTLVPLFRKKGLSHGAITHGIQGAVLWDLRQAFWVRSEIHFKSRLVIGAGDGFLAGYLAAFQAGLDLKTRSRWASAAAATVADYGIQGFKAASFKQNLTKVQIGELA
jgi:fructose-1-phosphate kinase PfkB-like protein